jgi:hypothetical protein
VNEEKIKRLVLKLSKEILPEEKSEKEAEDPYFLFLYGMKSPKTKEKCIGRLRMFFDSINIVEGSTVERSLAFYKKSKEDNRWAYRSIIRYFQAQKDDRYTPRGSIKRKNSNILKLIVP